MPYLDRHLEGDHTGREARDDEHRVPGEEVPRPVAGICRGLGGRDRCRVHHDDADRKQQQRGPGERTFVQCGVQERGDVHRHRSVPETILLTAVFRVLREHTRGDLTA